MPGLGQFARSADLNEKLVDFGSGRFLFFSSLWPYDSSLKSSLELPRYRRQRSSASSLAVGENAAPGGAGGGVRTGELSENRPAGESHRTAVLISILPKRPHRDKSNPSGRSACRERQWRRRRHDQCRWRMASIWAPFRRDKRQSLRQNPHPREIHWACIGKDRGDGHSFEPLVAGYVDTILGGNPDTAIAARVLRLSA